jgi:hypothetical protein
MVAPAHLAAHGGEMPDRRPRSPFLPMLGDRGQTLREPFRFTSCDPLFPPRRGACHAVETAIDLRKERPRASWETLVEEMTRRGVRPIDDSGAA